jgi:hypothetical protein
MTLTFSSTTLADGSTADLLQFRVSGDLSVQVAAMLRASRVKVFPRGNRQFSIAAKVSRTYSTPSDAYRAACSEGDALPASGSLVLTTDDAGSVTIAGAVLTSVPAPQQIGINLEWDYSWTASGPVTASPSIPILDLGGTNYLILA